MRYFGMMCVGALAIAMGMAQAEDAHHDADTSKLKPNGKHHVVTHPDGHKAHASTNGKGKVTGVDATHAKGHALKFSKKVKTKRKPGLVMAEMGSNDSYLIAEGLNTQAIGHLQVWVAWVFQIAPNQYFWIWFPIEVVADASDAQDADN